MLSGHPGRRPGSPMSRRGRHPSLEQQLTPIPTEIILFSLGEEVCCLCFPATAAASLQASLTPAQSGGMRQDSQSSRGECREGGPELSTPEMVAVLTQPMSSSYPLLLAHQSKAQLHW